MTPTETAIRVVKDYKRYVTPLLGSWCGKELLAERSLARWAVDEILSELKKNENQPPLDILERLRKRWDDAACSKKGEAGRAYSIAYDTITDVIDYLIK